MGNDFEKFGDILKSTTVNSSKPVNSKDEYINTVNGIPLEEKSLEEKINDLLEESHGGTDYVAQMLADGLDDQKSLPYFRLLVKEHGSGKLLEVLHYIQDVARTKTIHNKPAYFMAILKRKGLKTKFRREADE